MCVSGLSRQLVFLVYIEWQLSIAVKTRNQMKVDSSLIFSQGRTVLDYDASMVNLKENLNLSCYTICGPGCGCMSKFGLCQQFSTGDESSYC